MTFVALRSREDYNRVFRRGATHHATYFTFRIYKQDKPQLRLAVVVSKKVSGKATVRNLLRRRIREYTRKHESATRGRDIIIHVKPEALKLTQEELYKQLAQAIDLMKRKNIY